MTAACRNRGAPMIGCDDDYVAPKMPFDYLSRDQVQDLWGAGFTVIRRNTFGDDLYEIADRVCRPGMAQQWGDANRKKEFVADGWEVVPSERYPGLFAPYSYVGDVEIGGLILLECPKHKVEKAKAAQVAAAHKLVDDWKEKWGGQFSGEATVGTQTVKIGETKTIENVTAIPRELTSYIAQIFNERDRITKQYADEANTEVWTTRTMEIIHEAMIDALNRDYGAPKWPTLNAIVLPYAIENIRKQITKEANSGKAS